jgi:hypothetical protein
MKSKGGRKMAPTPRSKILAFDSPIQFRPLTHGDREILLEMYRGFEPLGLDRSAAAKRRGP